MISDTFGFIMDFLSMDSVFLYMIPVVHAAI